MEQDNGNLLLSIQLNYNQFTKTEKKIADYVLQNAQDVPFMSITELAEGCGVAEAWCTASAARFRSRAIRTSRCSFPSHSTTGSRWPMRGPARRKRSAQEESLFQKILSNNLRNP